MKQKGNVLIRILLPVFVFLQSYTLPAEEESRQLVCTDLRGVPLCGATSYLQEGDDWGKYHMKNLFDRNRDTAWVESAEGDGIGEEVWFEIEPGIGELILVNGYAKNRDLFLRNNRVKTLSLRIWVGVQEPGQITEIGPVFKAVPAGPSFTAELKDSPEPQSIPMQMNWDLADQKLETLCNSVDAIDRASYFLVLTLKEVYRGTHYRDTCIAEVSWKLDPAHSGPSGIGKLDIQGEWEVEKGSLWESIQIEWLPPAYQQWSSYLHGQLFDSGSWVLEKGVLKLHSEGGSGEEFVFTRARRENGRLLLEEQDGTIHVWKKQNP